eukprot:gnl/TRDRNA2_/TRDRNA2_198409_c0_seq1.p1 gnl/TRDRNA2_/TRDRNA2_198409_c0~~gnl/TRDRNA2_/TRDRNA2_198409_c0_seq1.p1  ORF type:complete len:374 (-),score=39.51 gnl/TRDRNA2_/TRDRNA2_198409_c0_seq1:131-1174(-)
MDIAGTLDYMFQKVCCVARVGKDTAVEDVGVRQLLDLADRCTQSSLPKNESGPLDDTRRVKCIAKGLFQRNEGVRLAAAHLLGEVGLLSLPHVEDLKDVACHDKSSRVRSAAHAALQRLAGCPDVMRLIEAAPDSSSSSLGKFPAPGSVSEDSLDWHSACSHSDNDSVTESHCCKTSLSAAGESQAGPTSYLTDFLVEMAGCLVAKHDGEGLRMVLQDSSLAALEREDGNDGDSGARVLPSESSNASLRHEGLDMRTDEPTHSASSSGAPMNSYTPAATEDTGEPTNYVTDFLAEMEGCMVAKHDSVGLRRVMHNSSFAVLGRTEVSADADEPLAYAATTSHSSSSQ